MSEHWLRERAVVRDHLVALCSGNDLAFAYRVSETRQALLNGAARGPAFDHPPWESAFAECDGVPDLLHVRGWELVTREWSRWIRQVGIPERNLPPAEMTFRPRWQYVASDR